MKLYVVPANTKGFKIVGASLVSTTTTREIVADRGRLGINQSSGAYLVDDPIIAHNENRIKIDAPKKSYHTVGDDMTAKGYSTFIFVDKDKKHHVLFVPFNSVRCI